MRMSLRLIILKLYHQQTNSRPEEETLSLPKLGSILLSLCSYMSPFYSCYIIYPLKLVKVTIKGTFLMTCTQESAVT